jgi:hypothetical protein
MLYTDDIDSFSFRMKTEPPAGIWDTYKKLRKYGLNRDQIGILIRKFCLGMTSRQIMEAMGWTSHQTFYRRYRAALKDLKTRGFGGK